MNHASFFIHRLHGGFHTRLFPWLDFSQKQPMTRIAIDFCVGAILLALVACLCIPCWSLGFILLWSGTKLMATTHRLHFCLQKAALKLAGSLE